MPFTSPQAIARSSLGGVLKESAGWGIAANGSRQTARQMHLPVSPLYGKELAMSKEAKSSSSIQLRGKVLGFNLSPKGHIAGALIDTQTGP